MKLAKNKKRITYADLKKENDFLKKALKALRNNKKVKELGEKVKLMRDTEKDMVKTMNKLAPLIKQLLENESSPEEKRRQEAHIKYMKSMMKKYT